MPRYKAFSSREYGEDVRALERAVNDWMQQEMPRILFASQSPYREHLVLTFVYDTGATGSAVGVAEAAEVPEVFERNFDSGELDPNEQPDVLLPEAELPY